MPSQTLTWGELKRLARKAKLMDKAPLILAVPTAAGRDPVSALGTQMVDRYVGVIAYAVDDNTALVLESDTANPGYTAGRVKKARPRRAQRHCNCGAGQSAPAYNHSASCPASVKL